MSVAEDPLNVFHARDLAFSKVAADSLIEGSQPKDRNLLNIFRASVRGN